MNYNHEGAAIDPANYENDLWITTHRDVARGDRLEQFMHARQHPYTVQQFIDQISTLDRFDRTKKAAK